VNGTHYSGLRTKRDFAFVTRLCLCGGAGEPCPDCNTGPALAMTPDFIPDCDLYEVAADGTIYLRRDTEG
jgi:hypothetical protein